MSGRGRSASSATSARACVESEVAAGGPAGTAGGRTMSMEWDEYGMVEPPASASRPSDTLIRVAVRQIRAARTSVAAEPRDVSGELAAFDCCLRILTELAG